MENFAYVATATVATARGERYAKQLISHWGRHAERIDEGPTGEGTAEAVLEFAATERFPATAVRLSVTPEYLVVTSYAHDAAALRANNDALADHLRRWAGPNEDLVFDWTPRQA
jgi:hypothetical protein